MKKTKSLMSILAMVFAVLGVVVLTCSNILDALIGKPLGGVGVNPKAHLGNILDRLQGLFPAIPTAFENGHAVGAVATLAAGVIAIVLFVVCLVMLIVKKQGKELGLVIPAFVLGMVAVLALGSYVIPEALFDENYFCVTNFNLIGIAVIILLALSIACLVVALILNIVMAAKAETAKKPAEAKEENKGVVVEEKTTTEPVKETIVPVAAEKAPEAVAKEEVKGEESVKVVRRILVHRSGKVVRVLNEHYFDVTTNIYVEPGYTAENAPKETEQEHYEKILKASAQPAPAPAPAPKAEPAPAPVVEEAPKASVKIERIPFQVRMKKADKGLKLAYNELKSEILSYGIKSRISSTGDTFRLHTKTYVKIVIAGKSLKLYFALNPKDYKDSTFPILDGSKKVSHQDTPLVFKVKSDLSIRRAKQLIADCAAKDGLVQGEVVKHDHAKEVK